MNNENQQLLEFISSRFKSFCNCNNITTREEIRKALQENKERWIKEFIILTK